MDPIPPEDLFQNTPRGHVFHFTYEGEPRALRTYLAERYRYWLRGDFATRAFPHRVRLNHQSVAEDTWIRPGDLITYHHARAEEPVRPAPPLVLFEDEWLLVLHKPDDVPVSPSGPHYFASVAIHAREAFSNPELTPVHRLDLETGGPLIFAKRSGDLKRIHRLFLHKTLAKTYRSLVHGRFPHGLARIAGRIVPDPVSPVHTRLTLVPDPASEHSITEIRRVAHLGTFSELELSPITGKTNQLRVHLAHHGHPIVGDKKYHPDESVFLEWLAHKDWTRLRRQLLLPRQALQCAALEFSHPFTEQPLRITAPPGAWRRKIAAVVDSVLEPA